MPTSPPELTAANHRALAAVADRAARRGDSTNAQLALLLEQQGLPRVQLQGAMAGIRSNAQVVLNFHPDRPDRHGRLVVESLLTDGLYRNQFETGLSNGSLSAFDGGERDRWEARLFDGAYQHPGVGAGERPKYGALDLLHHGDGAAPRFGGCYFRLKPGVSARCSFSYGDSVFEPEHLATLDHCESLMLPLLREIVERGGALGGREMAPDALFRHLAEGLEPARFDCQGPLGRSLDDYIEAQIHGPVRLAEDVERLVADPAFKGTPMAEQLERLAGRYRFPLTWHRGFRLRVDRVPDNFRGEAMLPLARRIGQDGWLDVAMIGAAVQNLCQRPELWRDWGSQGDTLQYLKQLWHVLVQFGEPVTPEAEKSNILFQP